MSKTALLLPVLFVAACGGEIGPLRETAKSGSDSRLFDQKALAVFAPEARAYVMGHALGVYLYGNTLPRWVAGTGYDYQPGVSAEHARIAYSYRGLVSGELDSSTMPATQPGDDCYRSSEETICPDVPVDGSGDGNTIGADPTGGGEATPTADGSGGDDPTGDGSSANPGDGSGDNPNDPMIDDDCESFLDPAAMEARALASRVDTQPILEEGFGDDVTEREERSFRAGVADSLALEDRDEDTDASEIEHLKNDVQDAGLCEHSPLVLDLDGNGVDAGHLLSGVLFDLKETGAPLLTAWPSAEDALLVLDRDGDGRITNGGELFGSSKKPEGGRFDDGFQALARLDLRENGGNEDGVINAKDAAYARLMLWRDRNRDAVSSEDELTSIDAAGVVELPLAHEARFAKDAHGNRLGEWGHFIKNTAEEDTKAKGTMVDVWFRIRPVREPIL